MVGTLKNDEFTELKLMKINLGMAIDPETLFFTNFFKSNTRRHLKTATAQTERKL